MGWSRQIEASPAKADEALAGLEPPERQEERAQFEAAVKAARLLVATVSGRERVLISLGGHSDPDGDGFNARHAGATVSRIDPEALRQREEAERAQRELEKLAAEAEEDTPDAP
jgi:hypothetical protein